MSIYVIQTEAVADAPEGTVIHAPIKSETFEADFTTAYEDFTAEVERQLAFGPPHNHDYDEDDPDSMWQEDCPWCDDAMIWENWASAEGEIIQGEYIDQEGWIAIGLSHVDVILRKLSD